MYGQFKEMLQVCTAGLTGDSQEKDSFGFGWSQFVQNYTPPFGYQAMYNSFQYQDADKLQGSPMSYPSKLRALLNQT